MISGSEYPTSNLFLPELANIKEVLDEKSECNDGYIKEMSNTMKSPDQESKEFSLF